MGAVLEAAAGVTAPPIGSYPVGFRPAPAAVTAWIGLGPGLNEPAGFAVDLDRVLAVLPRRHLVPPTVAAPAARSRRMKDRGRWSGGQFPAFLWPNMARMWARGKGWRR
jgi:hypothetical protein